jgi:hypothetical protein
MSKSLTNAQQRREEELRQLAVQGFAVTAVSRWHYTIGDLHIWPAVGRWVNEKSGRWGKIKDIPLNRLLRQQNVTP